MEVNYFELEVNYFESEINYFESEVNYSSRRVTTKTAGLNFVSLERGSWQSENAFGKKEKMQQEPNRGQTTTIWTSKKKIKKSGWGGEFK